MPQAARANDPVMGSDVHIVLVPSPSGTVPTPAPHPYAGKLSTNLSRDVQVNGLAVATVGSGSMATSPHIPSLPGSFANPPTGKGQVMVGSLTVMVNGRGMARQGDQVATCTDVPGSGVSSITGGSLNVVVG